MEAVGTSNTLLSAHLADTHVTSAALLYHC